MVIVMNNIIYGVGINDSDCNHKNHKNTKSQNPYFYRTWHSMIQRCYDKNSLLKRPTYVDCSVCEEWLTFSNFKRWMETQDWQGKQLDKDLLFVGNKVYSPDTCVFVDKATNVFVTDRLNFRGEWPLGVRFHKKNCSFEAQCSDPFKIRSRSVGYFKCPNQAHAAWRKRKHEISCQLADLQTDERVAVALRIRYA